MSLSSLKPLASSSLLTELKLPSMASNTPWSWFSNFDDQDIISKSSYLLLFRLLPPHCSVSYTSFFTADDFVQFSCSVVSDSLWPHGLQHTRLLCPSPSPGVRSNPCPLSRWCHPTISSSVAPFSSCLQSFPASGSFPVSQFFAPSGQSFGASASTTVLPMNTEGWFPLGLTRISLLSTGLSRAISLQLL